MLKYSVKLTENDFKGNNIVWKEKYVAPDLSFISGVTNSSYHLEKYNTISVKSPLTNNNSVLRVETEVVTRTGYVIAIGKKYPIETFNGISYVCINDRFFYKNNNKFIIKDWQCEKFIEKNGKYIPTIVEQDVEATPINDKYIKLNTVYWIEDGFVTIDGTKYIFDKNEQNPNGTIGCVKFTDNGGTIDKPTNCDSMYFMPYDDFYLVHDVCKFKGYSFASIQHKVNDLKFCEYFFYINYLNNYCPIIQNGNTFVCQVPYNGDVSNVRNYTVSASTDDDTSAFVVTIGNDVKDINDLRKFRCFITIDGTEYTANYDYRETSSSRFIMAMFENQGATIGIGNEVTFVNASNDDTCYINVENGTVFYNGVKYYVDDKLFDKAKINDNEYDITYDKLDSSIAYVDIEGEQVPMSKSGNRLTRYGLVIKSDGVVANESYDIVSYSGVVIEGKKYIVKDGLARLTLPNKIKFVVDDIKGSSLFVLKPLISPNDYSYDYIKNKEIELSNMVVNNKSQYSLEANNVVFGTKSISKESVFSDVTSPITSDDAYRIFDNLIIEDKSGYVNIPLNLSNDTALNLLQSEVVKKDFCEKERDKRINRIVDLEKDVYTPKILTSNRYVGSSTNFSPVHTININLHFRTRDLDSWKVNEDYNNVSYSGLCNWFITDYEPYKSMINAISGTSDGDLREIKYAKLIEHSDLLGFVYFDNNDVFYQKSRISKSFLRLSFYDSTDPQKQSLLATSTVFMNENSLYKKYIDNSRKGINKFVNFSEDINKCTISDKIRVSGERLANKKESEHCDDDDNFVIVDYIDDEGFSQSYCVSLKEDGKRLDSRFVINNKYSTDTSSEGFYIYMFREYSENLHPKPIYMKVEFNHAGIGKTIPFIVPMHWNSGCSESAVNGEVYPCTALTLANLEELKRGIPLSWVYAQSYVPLYAVYDFKNKEYAYTFDDRYVTIDDNGNVILNLFEIKIMNDTKPDSNYGTAVINVNPKYK